MNAGDQVKKLMVVTFLVLVVFSRINLTVEGKEVNALQLFFSKFPVGGLVDPLFDMFGFGEETYCPFFNPYMTKLMALEPGDEPIVITKEEPLYPVLADVLNAKHITVEDRIYVVFDGKKFMLFTSQEAYDPYFVRYSQKVEGQSVGRSPIAFIDKEELLNYFASEWGAGLVKKIPMWQCFLVFGLVPFAAMFFLFEDILNFSLFSPKVRAMVSFMASVIAVYSGAFAKFVWQLAAMSTFTITGSFFTILLAMSMFSMVLSWFRSLSGVTAEIEKESEKIKYEMYQKGLSNVIGELGRNR